MPARAPLAPKLAAWLGWAALELAGGAVVVVVVTPAAGRGVVTLENACWRTSGASKALSARFTGSANVRPPSRLVATTGRGGTAFGAATFGLLMRKVTCTTSSLPVMRSTARECRGRMFSAASPVLPRALYTITVSQESPKFDERASTMAPPWRAPSWSSQAFIAMYTVPLRPKAIGAWITPPCPWEQKGKEARAGD